jgi:hypothetical protein
MIDEADRTQAQIAAGEIAAAIREFAPGSAGWEEIAATFDGIGDLLSGSIRLEGDYDVLVARKMRALAALFRSSPLPDLEAFIATMRTLRAEVCEALGLTPD